MAYTKVLDPGSKEERVKVFWEVKTLNGTRKRKSKTFLPGTPKRVIEQFKREKEYEFDHMTGIDVTKRTLADFGEEYFTIHAVNLSPTTIEGYLQMYNMKGQGVLSYLNPDIPLNKVTATLLQKYLNDLSENHSRKTVKNYKAFLSSLFTKAYQLQYISFNPSSSLVVPKKRGNQKVEIEAYDIEEAKTILRLAKKKGLNVWLIEGLGILAGLRKGEIAGLRFENVCIDDGLKELHIVENRVQAMGNIYIKDPKTTSSFRVVQIPDILAEILKYARADYKRRKILYGERFVDSGYVVNQQHGEQYAPDTIYNIHNRFLRSEEVKETGIKYTRLHGLRHTFCSIQINSTNINPKVLQSQLGHKDVSTTLNLYAHVFESSKREEADKLNDIMKINIAQ